MSFIEQNPYAPPQAPTGNNPNLPKGSELVVPCYKCGSTYAIRVGFTWWGGLLGPKLFNHVKCVHCSTTFNAKTGKSNDKAIMIYVVVCVAVGLVLGILTLFI